MKKHTYRAKNINGICIEKLVEELNGVKVVVAVDVAKHDYVVGIAGSDGEIVEHVKFTHPEQTRAFMDLLEALRQRGDTEVVLEPTGTYGDALVEQLFERGFAVFAMSPKRCHDAAEVFDGVPSLHDAKATMILARLHVQGLSKSWPRMDEARRAMRAAVARREIYASPLEAHRGRLEALLSRYWPEFGQQLDLSDCKTGLALLVEYPGPEAVAHAPEGAARRMKQYSQGRLTGEKIAKVLATARDSLGVPMCEEERKLLGALAEEMLELWNEVDHIEDEIARMAEAYPASRALSQTVGMVTSAILVAMLGPASAYRSADAYVKAMGLNLKEHSSGSSKRPGTGLHITKRGPGVVRKYLFMATLRLIQRDPVCRAWYERRRAYQRGEKLKAVVALMRKLTRALWHVGHGERFDATKLFDTRHLKKRRTAKADMGRIAKVAAC